MTYRYERFNTLTEARARRDELCKQASSLQDFPQLYKGHREYVVRLAVESSQTKN